MSHASESVELVTSLVSWNHVTLTVNIPSMICVEIWPPAGSWNQLFTNPAPKYRSTLETPQPILQVERFRKHFFFCDDFARVHVPPFFFGGLVVVVLNITLQGWWLQGWVSSTWICDDIPRKALFLPSKKPWYLLYIPISTISNLPLFVSPRKFLFFFQVSDRIRARHPFWHVSYTKWPSIEILWF